MTPQLPSSPYTGPGAAPLSGIARNRVLRNTLGLLALSLVPTVFGAWLGMASGFSFFANSPLLAMAVFLGVSFAFFFGIERFKNTGLGVVLLLGFTFFMGLMMSRLLGQMLGMANGGALVMTAFGGTAAIFGVMAGVASVSRRDFSGMAHFLTIGAVLILFAAVGNVFLQLPALHLTLLVLVVAIFSGLVLVDLQRIVRGGETNYVTATLSVYLSLYNIFTALLQLLGIFGGERD